MCMAYSGRCLLSSTLTGRDANRGDCAQPCRWEYTLSEEKRPGLFFPIVEEGGQSYVMNSKDLNLIRHLPDLIASGVDSLKIEGRMKSLYYVAAVCRVYRDALDTYRQDPDGFRFREIWWEELAKISHRDYTTGFLEDSADGEMQDTERGGYIQEYEFVGIVTERREGRRVVVEARNKFHRGDRIEWIGPGMASFTSTIEEMRDIDNAPLPFAQPEQTVLTQAPDLVAPHFLLRRKRG
jgi:putative protease